MSFLNIYVEQYNKNSKEISQLMEKMTTTKDFNQVDKLLQSNQDLVGRADAVEQHQDRI